VKNRRPTIVSTLLALALLGACATASGDPAPPSGAVSPDSSSSTEASPTPSLSPLPPAPPPPPPRSVHEQAYTPFATVEGVTLFHPSRRIEHVGFHESNHDGARQMAIVRTTVVPLVLESRERLTGSHTAADIVTDPTQPIRSPVTGTVIRGGSYTLYCDTRDHYVVIEPDARPGWEVKVLHMNNLNVRKGQRVTAGRTVLASAGAHQLPFKSQVDEMKTADPAWPHVHVEVVDPSIPDRPSPGGGC
jgi:murein DD-endopeptidase MepM/ murein hydrolase activator NlpD